MTTSVIAALPESGDRYYNIYVKLTVYYPKYTKQYTTKIKEKSTGWTSIGKMFRLDKAPKDASILIQIWDDNTYKIDEKLYEEKTTLSSLIDRIIFEHSTIKNNSKLFMVSIWRDNYDFYDDKEKDEKEAISR